MITEFDTKEDFSFYLYEHDVWGNCTYAVETPTAAMRGNRGMIMEHAREAWMDDDSKTLQQYYEETRADFLSYFNYVSPHDVQRETMLTIIKAGDYGASKRLMKKIKRFYRAKYGDIG
jgi:glutamate mutase epsilon subunit